MAECNHHPAWYGQWWWLSCWWPQWREQSICCWLFLFFLFQFPSISLFSLSPFKPPVVTVDCLQDMSKTKYLVHRGHVLGLPHAYIIKTHRNAGNDCSSLQYKSIYLFQQPSQIHTHLPVFGLRLSLCFTMCTYCMSFNPWCQYQWNI